MPAIKSTCKRTLLFVAVLLAAGCTARPPAVTPVPADFPLAKGTTWKYAYRPYQPAADPTQIVSAEYRLTETVTDVATTSSGLIVAHVQRELQPVQVPDGWVPPSLPGEFWYVLKGTQVFQSNPPVDPAAVDTAALLLAFDLPLSAGQSWCPQQVDPKNPNPSAPGCDFAGKVTVLQAAAAEVPAGKYADCYQLQTFFNDGSTFQWFCRGVGVVSIQYAHGGTRFGFKQELTGFTPGAN